MLLGICYCILHLINKHLCCKYPRNGTYLYINSERQNMINCFIFQNPKSFSHKYTKQNLIRKDFSNLLPLGVVRLYLLICDFQEKIYTAESNGFNKKYY